MEEISTRKVSAACFMVSSKNNVANSLCQLVILPYRGSAPAALRANLRRFGLPGSDRPQSFQRRLVVDRQGGTFQHGKPLLADLRQYASYGFARGADDLRNFIVGQGEPHLAILFRIQTNRPV